MTSNTDLTQKGKGYTSDDIDVRFDGKRCIHAAECVNRLSAVFDVDKRPWIQPENSEADTIADVVHRCPSGALHYTRKDDGSTEQPDAVNTIRVQENGPLYLRGTLKLVSSNESETATDTRLALCRCGASEHKPYCDNTHLKTGFEATDALADNTHRSSDEAPAENVELAIMSAKDGPLLLEGEFEIISTDGETVFRGKKTALCRCGASANKPFCDGSHHGINFQAD
jgi:CDGSH-type Zn-finger protein/uncharacterized Fe-S cluster protein YjdI